MSIELEKFITDLDEHMKAKNVIPDDHIKRLLGFLGNVGVAEKKCRNGEVETVFLKDIVNTDKLESEVRNIVAGARSDLIYEYEEFVRQFVEEKTEEEIEE